MHISYIKCIYYTCNVYIIWCMYVCIYIYRERERCLWCHIQSTACCPVQHFSTKLAEEVRICCWQTGRRPAANPAHGSRQVRTKRPDVLYCFVLTYWVCWPIFSVALTHSFASVPGLKCWAHQKAPASDEAGWSWSVDQRWKQDGKKYR